MPPKLLVSVRDPHEARIAAEAGAQIVDIKEPRHGSLGMANEKTIAECAAAVRSVQARRAQSQILCSAACGEVNEWSHRKFLGSGNLPQLDFLKVGFSGLARDGDWEEKWDHVRELMAKSMPQVDVGNWIAVAYVDVSNAVSPTIDSIIAAAAKRGCGGVLFDTFHKGAQRFSDYLDEASLLNYLKQIHKAEMFCSVAGRLTMSDVSRLSQLPVDVIAVRSAACEGGERNTAISAQRIRELQQRIADASAGSSGSSAEESQGEFRT